jgi:sec-independent protein translocase protein TatC
LALGLAFEFPLILVILQVLGVIAPSTLRSGRRFAILIIAVAGGLLAPSPDVLSMIGMMIPMIILYEGSIIVGEILRRRRLAAQAKREAAEAAKR